MHLTVPITIASLMLLAAVPSIAVQNMQNNEQDPFLWLESETEQTRQWVAKQNKTAQRLISSQSDFKAMYDTRLAHGLTKGSYPEPMVVGEQIYSLVQNNENPLGALQRTSFSSYVRGEPDWEVVLDIDLLSQKENTRWIFKSIDCLLPEAVSCFVGLARAGIDYVSYREFDSQKKRFIDDGFPMFVSKDAPKWVDKQRIYVGLTQQADSVTEHSFAANIKLWKRHTPIEQAKSVYAIPKQDLGLFIYDFIGAGTGVLAGHYKSFHDVSYYLLDGEESYPIVADGISKVYGVFEDAALVKLGADHKNGKRVYAAGSVVAISLDSIRARKPEFELIQAANAKHPIEDISVTQNSLLIQRLVDVKSEATLIKRDSKGKILATKSALPGNGVIEPVATLYEDNLHLVSYESFVSPSTLYLVGLKQKPKQVYQQNAVLNGEDFNTVQYFATSRDGTRVPYFMVHRKNMAFNTSNPTMIRAYGGFNISNLPRYSASMTAWLDTGAVLVMANVRGGGEYGESWHRAAIKENKFKSFEDLIAVAEDLIAKKVTSTEHLGLFGISAGGLLVTSTAVKRPDLFKAVAAGAPLIDMLRYHRLGDGSPYIGEYGDPENADEKQYIRQYSPYHNINGDKQPAYLFVTSSKDMRVHPAHARKMAARLQSLDHEALFYEFADGGHAAAVGFDERAFRDTLIIHFMFSRLSGDRPL